MTVELKRVIREANADVDLPPKKGRDSTSDVTGG